MTVRAAKGDEQYLCLSVRLSVCPKFTIYSKQGKKIKTKTWKGKLQQQGKLPMPEFEIN
jgi:hypothetical protein